MLTRGPVPFHLQVNPADMGGYVLLTGDPGRVPLIAALLDAPEEVACNREFRVHTGGCLVCRSASCPPASAGRLRPLPWKRPFSAARIPVFGLAPAAV